MSRTVLSHPAAGAGPDDDARLDSGTAADAGSRPRGRQAGATYGPAGRGGATIAAGKWRSAYSGMRGTDELVGSGELTSRSEC